MTMENTRLREWGIVIRGAGDIATGVAFRLYRSRFRRILMLDIAAPMAVRRNVSFGEAIYEGRQRVEGIEAVRVDRTGDLPDCWREGRIPVMVDPEGDTIKTVRPEVVVDAIIAKRNLGTRISDAELVVGLGPGFEAGKDAHVVVETNRGHYLGRLMYHGRAEANTGIPGAVAGISAERVFRSPADGRFESQREIGDQVQKGEEIGRVGHIAVQTEIDGIIRGLIRPGTMVTKSLKLGDIDPRCRLDYCETISEKALAVGGAVLEAILSVYNRSPR